MDRKQVIDELIGPSKFMYFVEKEEQQYFGEFKPSIDLDYDGRSNPSSGYRGTCIAVPESISSLKGLVELYMKHLELEAAEKRNFPRDKIHLDIDEVVRGLLKHSSSKNSEKKDSY